MRNPRNSRLSYLLLSGAAGLVTGALAVETLHRLRPLWSAPDPDYRTRNPTYSAEPNISESATSGRRRVAGVSIGLAGIVLLAAATGGFLITERAAEARRAWADNLTGGKAARAIALIAQNGCGGCHEIPGAPGADGDVGPPLAGVAQRAYLGGAIANSPENLAIWIRDARAVDPHSAMPTIGISQRDARDIAAYLYALPD